MAIRGTAPFATFMIVGPTCFFLGILFALFPYDYYVLWSMPAAIPGDPSADPRAPYFTLQENHLKFIHQSPPLINRILHIAIGVGLMGFMLKLYKPSQANMLFDGASLVLYTCGVVVYAANIVKGLRIVTAGAYGNVGESVGGFGEDLLMEQVDAQGKIVPPSSEGEFIGREDSLRVLAASNTILALVLVGVLVLQAGQWYAQRVEAQELDQMDKARDEKRLKAKEAAGGGKKRQ